MCHQVKKVKFDPYFTDHRKILGILPYIVPNAVLFEVVYQTANLVPNFVPNAPSSKCEKFLAKMTDLRGEFFNTSEFFEILKLHHIWS